TRGPPLVGGDMVAAQTPVPAVGRAVDRRVGVPLHRAHAGDVALEGAHQDLQVSPADLLPARDGARVEATGRAGHGALGGDDPAAVFHLPLHAAHVVEVRLQALLVLAAHLAAERPVGLAHRVHDGGAPQPP